MTHTENAEGTRRLIAGVALPLAATIAAIASVALAAGTIPDPLATHWSVSGEPDGSMSRSTFLTFAVAVPALAGVGVFAASRRRDIHRGELSPPVAIATFVQWLMLGIVVMVLVANSGADTWRDASELPVAVALLAPAAAVLASLTASRIVGPVGRPLEPPEPPATVGARAGERLAWFSETRTRWPIVLAAAMATAGTVIALTAARLLGVVFLAAAAVIVAFAVLRVSADRSGVVVRFGPLGWPRVRVPLESIQHAEVIDVRPGKHGGWGYRGSLRVFGRAAVVVRRGAGISLELEDGKRFVVTTDGAEVGAGTINDLLATAASPEPAT